ncbi:iron complex outermembrane receptor protein [Methylopila capsulata]|uniref:Iron complex outermembrane receptor protein n=1 Tax=Methylopila capsulata TaxID=61654 RepID=A0A9W6MRG0_9HYPH|nr:TonB-dependent receptor [Methylopila capsulata]MBM7850382.1 iron complex outermembrane receptor protein [Methylopila capsulata]GLK55675.1 TonB-dependent receptor [Methylopila capsulata]
MSSTACRAVVLATLGAASISAASAEDSGAIALEEISVQGEGSAVNDGSPGQILKRSTEAASRLGLTVRETPAMVDVITQDRLQEQGSRSLIEAYMSAPGVVAGNLPGEPGVTAIRGFSRGAVGYSVDGVRAIDPLIASRNYDSYSFDRIEILKGPASVVSGSGALAGTINLVTRKPELGVTKADALLSYGSFDTVRAGASFNAPISENAAASASVLYGRSGGYVNDTDSENVQVTTGLTLKPTDRLTITAAFDYFRDDFSTAYFGTPLIPRDAARNPSGAVSAGDLVLDKSIWKKNYNVDDGVMKSDAIWARTGAAFQLTDQWTLKNDFAFYSADRLWRNSEDYTYDPEAPDPEKPLRRGLTLISHDQQSWTNRTSANFDGDIGGRRNRFVAGFEYMRTEFGSKRRFGSTTFVDPFNPDRGDFPDATAGFDTRQNFDSTVDNSAVFLENALNITPEWIVVAGLRHDWIDLDRKVRDLNAGTTTTFGNDYSSTTWRLGTVYDLTPEVSLFAQYTTAISPVSGLLLSNSTRAGLDLTTGKSIEAGVKTSLLGGRLLATASVYQIEQHDIIRTYTGGVTEQGGDQRSRGVEFDVSLAVTEQWKINANAAILKAEFTKLDETEIINGKLESVSRKGNRPLNVPEQTFNLWTTYRLASVPVTFGAGVRHVGDFYTDNANTIRVDGRTLLDASIAYDVPVGGTLTLRGRNLTNRFYAEWSGYSSTQVYVGAPRSFDLTYSVKF